MIRPTRLMRRVIPFVAACAAAIAALEGCWHAPFDPDLSASVYTTNKLGDAVWGVKMHTNDKADGYYLPTFDPTYYSTGYWIVPESGTLRVTNMSFTNDSDISSSSGNVYVTQNTQYRAAVLQGAPSAYYYRMYVGANLSGGMVRAESGATTNWASSYPVGFGYSPLPNGTYSNDGSESVTPTIGGFSLCVADWDSSSDTVTAYQMYVDGSESFMYYNTVSVTNPPSLVGLANPAGPCFAAINQADNGYLGALYLSGLMSDGKVKTYRWTTPLTSTPEQLPLGLRVTGMLSDGRLLADTGDSLYVYDKNGKNSFEIKTGALRFAHEYYDSINAKWISVFTRTFYVPQSSGDDEREVIIQVYHIDTADLDTLAY